MAKSVVALRAAIVKAVQVLSGEDEVTLSLEPSGDKLVLGFGDPALPIVTLGETLTETLVELAQETVSQLEAAADEQEEKFKEDLDGEMQEIRDLTDIEDVTEWQGILDDIVRTAQAIKRRLDSDSLEDANNLREAAETLTSAISEFEEASNPIALVS